MRMSSFKTMKDGEREIDARFEVAKLLKMVADFETYIQDMKKEMSASLDSETRFYIFSVISNNDQSKVIDISK